MKQKLLTILAYVRHHQKLVIGVGVCAVLIPILLVVFCYALIAPNEKYILTGAQQKHATIGLVLGAGVTKDGKPYKELQARLDIAAQAIHDKRVDKLLLSGDNRFKSYDEPAAMKNYLINVKHIPVSKLQVDDAGRSTYESCERANRVFGLQQTIIFSAESHLPRAIFLCRHFDIESYGIATHVEANNSQRREALARVKAVFNVYVYGEKTILGAPIRF